jgi:hypothetical protein
MSAEASNRARPRSRVVSSSKGGARALNLPRPARVRVQDTAPCVVNGERVEAVRESWLVEDRWWSERPLRRRYWELVGERGRNQVVFHDLCAGGWFTQGG